MRSRAKALRAFRPYVAAAAAGGCLQLISSGLHLPGSLDLGFFLLLFIMAASWNLDSKSFFFLLVSYSASEPPDSTDSRPEDPQQEEQSAKQTQSASEIRERERGAGL